MTLWLRLASYVLVAAVALSVGWSVNDWRRDSEELAIARTVAAVEARTAEQIAGIRVTRQTINGRVSEVIRERVEYRDCLLDDATRRLLDSARKGSLPADSGSGLPGSGASAAP